MTFLKKKPATLFGKNVSSVIPLLLNIIAFLFFCAGTSSTVYEDNDKKYSMWKYWNKTTDKQVWFEEGMAPCGDHHFYLKVGALYSIATLIFSLATILVNFFDFFGYPIVSKGHGILSIATVFVSAIAFTITISVMSFGVCADQLAPREMDGMKYGAAQPTEVVGCIVVLVASIFTYAF